MKSKYIRLTAAVMAAALTASALPTTVFAAKTSSTAAAESTDTAMKAALTKVKKRVSIPSELSEFTYSKNTSFGITAFSFTWQTPSDASEFRYLGITVAGDLIYSYEGSYGRENSSPRLARLTDDEIILKAKEALKKLNPSVYDKCRFEIDRINLFGNAASVSFTRYENDIPVNGNGGTIDIDKNNGSVIALGMNWWDGADFESPKKALSNQAAVNAFEKLCTLTPKYSVSTDWETGKQTAYLVYRPSFTDEINAFTGEASTIWDDMNRDKGTNGLYFNNNYALTAEACDEEAAADTGEGVYFTPAELNEIEADKTLLTKTQLTELLRKDSFVQLPSDFVLDNAYLSKNTDKEEYYYDLQYTRNKDDKYGSLGANMNAKTGAITGFSRWDNNGDISDSLPYPVKKCSGVANSAIKHFYPTICSEYKPDASNSDASASWISNGKTRYETSRQFVFNRYVNNVQVENDSIYANIDNTATLNSISYVYSEVKFPSAPKLDSSAAFKKLFEQQEMNLYYDGYYKKDGSVKTYLLYKTDSFTLDRSYKRCGYNGTPLTDADNGNMTYSDIKGIKQEKAIKALSRYGIGLSGKNGKFNPNETLSEGEFNGLVSSVIRNYVSYSYTNAKDEKNNAAITNTDAAKIFVELKYGTDVAELKGIFKSPFSDVSSDSKDAGYIAIAYASGFMKGANGKFSPNHKMTRAEAIQLIYDYVVYLSK